MTKRNEMAQEFLLAYEPTVDDVEKLIATVAEWGRQRGVALCNEAREKGESDLRQVRYWIEADKWEEEEV